MHGLTDLLIFVAWGVVGVSLHRPIGWLNACGRAIGYALARRWGRS